MTSSATQRAPDLHVFLGTKAQYIKTAPLLRLFDQRDVAYRLIDSGQHGALSIALRDELGVREPDRVLGDGRDVESIPQAILWALRLAWLLVRPSRLRRDVFGIVGKRGDQTGVCIVHGDTPSTLLATLLAKRVGMRVAHLEAGLTSGRLWDPLPEEAIRRLVMRFSDVLFAPDEHATQHLRTIGVKGQIVPVSANTVIEATAHALDGAEVPTAAGPAIVTMHRVENLKSPARIRALVDLLVEAAAGQPIRFVLHGPTEPALARLGQLERLRGAGIELVALQPHHAFVAMLDAAPWVITDGGSIQEECALLGMPTLLWRQRSERADGIGHNVVIGGHDRKVARRFLADPSRHRRPRRSVEVTPSEQIFAVLVADPAGLDGDAPGR